VADGQSGRGQTDFTRYLPPIIHFSPVSAQNADVCMRIQSKSLITLVIADWIAIVIGDYFATN